MLLINNALHAIRLPWFSGKILFGRLWLLLDDQQSRGIVGFWARMLGGGEGSWWPFGTNSDWHMVQY